MNGKKIFLGVCLNGFTAPEFISSLIRATANCQLGGIGLHPGNTCVYQARNDLAASFLKSDCTHLLFVDSDLIFQPWHVDRICSHDVPIVGGLYPIKTDGKLCVAVNDFHPEDRKPVLPSGCQQVRYVATGFMLIAREVFTKLLHSDGPAIEYQSDHPPHDTAWNFFRAEIREDKGRKRYLTEDWFFCQRWLELGGEVYADREIFLEHVGKAIYPLQAQRKELETCG